MWGPAGTGKTTAGTNVAKDWFARGAAPDQVAYLGFTRAAARAAASKMMDDEPFGDADELFPLFRTVHSLAFRGLKQAKQDLRLATQSDMKAFSKESGFEGTYAVSEWEDLAEVYQKLADHGRTHWDMALTAYKLSRVSARTPEDLRAFRTRMSPLACRTVSGLEEDVYRAFVGRYEAWKQKNGLIDFTDMLEFALCEMPALDACRYVIVDEAQDCGPIIHAIIDRLFSAAEETWWIGDDWQAIYGFAAASADLFLDRAETASCQIYLRHTHRFGQKIVDWSGKIIRRVEKRMDKEIIGVPGREGIVTVSGEFAPSPGSRFILHRHVMGCQEVASRFIDAGLPFWNERGKNPLGASVRVRGWTALNALAEGEDVGASGALLLVHELIPSTIIEEGEQKRLVVHGAKKRIEFDPQRRLTLRDLEAMRVLTDEGAKTVRQRIYGRLKHGDDLEYYGRVVKNGFDLDAEGAPVITTIHGSKGRQAEHVTVFSEMGRRCWDDPDTEHRLAYVAATRTRGDVEVCAEQLVDWAALRYDYPEEKS